MDFSELNAEVRKAWQTHLMEDAKDRAAAAKQIDEFMAVMKKAMEVYIHNNSPSDD